ncbi:MAG: hypothetical protein KGL39_25345 [Patescibacteria group bacterium]|nr:hypothetical protein [Patescibacteria group bacterium]
MSDWIKSAIHHKGALHKSLGIPTGDKIPMSVLQKHATGNSLMAHRARLAITLHHLSAHDESQTPESKFHARVDEAVKRHSKK